MQKKRKYCQMLEEHFSLCVISAMIQIYGTEELRKKSSTTFSDKARKTFF